MKILRTIKGVLEGLRGQNVSKERITEFKNPTWMRILETRKGSYRDKGLRL